MEQVYLIKKTNERGFEYVELAFNDYSEARKMALKQVDGVNKKNQKKYYYNVSSENKDLTELMPDIWSNGFNQIEIVALKMKSITSFRKPQNIQKSKLVKSVLRNEEVYL